ncbi:MAG TPA: 4-hydroxyphenylacetate 3-hydroxylase N-terminal domain-containing protein [Candidatus Binataceae bacterium]|nr:4-hydroxyphenylacetate 3-hydroxylase N-terminal domain-containing protein [Candidatus Binataceae bacterium]
MGARSGNNYLSALRKLKASLWLDDERIADPSVHPAFVRRARALASLYDLQAEHPEAMTYRLADGSRAGLSFIVPVTVEEVRKRGAMFRRWATHTGGAFLTPDRQNTALAAMMNAAVWIDEAERDADESRRRHRYYEQARALDWCCTMGETAAVECRGQLVPALNAVEQTSRELVVSGAVRLDELAPFAEEMLILGKRPERGILAFAASCNGAGITIHGHRDESQAQDPRYHAIFDRAAISWDRVFILNDLSDSADPETLLEAAKATPNLLHYDAIRALARAEAGLPRAAPGEAEPPRSGAALEGIAEARKLIAKAEAESARIASGMLVPAAEPLREALRLLAESAA